MSDRPTFDVGSWDAALTIVRQLVPEAMVTIPKEAEPTLPEGVSVRRSNVPWSIHKGAWRVYREDRPGDHLQIREYPDRWTVELDQHNPHYRPLRHVAVDTTDYTRNAARHPIGTASDVLVFGPVRSAQLAAGVATSAALAPITMLDTVLGRVVDSLERAEE